MYKDDALLRDIFHFMVALYKVIPFRKNNYVCLRDFSATADFNT